MNFKKTFQQAIKNTKAVIHWLAQPPKRNYTLGEFYQLYVQRKPPEEIYDNRLGFTRLGRGVERMGTIPLMAALGGAVLSAPTLAAAAVNAAAVVVTKIVFVTIGKMCDCLVRGAPKDPLIMSIADYRTAKEQKRIRIKTVREQQKIKAEKDFNELTLPKAAYLKEDLVIEPLKLKKPPRVKTHSGVPKP